MISTNKKLAAQVIVINKAMDSQTQFFNCTIRY